MKLFWLPVLGVAACAAALSLGGCEGSTAKVVRGSVTGSVKDGHTGAFLSGVTVHSLSSPETATSNGSGVYLLQDILAMPQTIQADFAGYNSGQLDVKITKDQTLPGANFVLLPTAYAANKVVIILTWGATPTDLDSHLYVPNGSPYFEVFYGALGDNDGTLDTNPFAGLDLDDTTSYGPETTTIKLAAGSPYYAGWYRFYVHNFSGDAPLTASGAQVNVYLDGVLTKTYDVPTTGTGDYWLVFDLNGTSFTDKNVIMATPPATPP